MNSLLCNNRPKDESKESFIKMWNGLGYGLSALANTLETLITTTNKVKDDDFSIPNHYALLAFEAGKRMAYKEILEMLPDSAKKD